MVHHINSYEVDENTIVVDYVTLPNFDLLVHFTMEKVLDPTERNKIEFEKCQIRRYTILLNTKKVLVSKFDSRPGFEFINRLDFPVINENYRYKNYCNVYGYSVKLDGVSMTKSALVKKNVCDSKNDLYWYKANHYPTEPTFVRRPNAVDEDDGVLLDVILDGKKRKSYIGIFDAKTMKLVNKAYLPTHVPITFHGRFFE